MQSREAPAAVAGVGARRLLPSSLQIDLWFEDRACKQESVNTLLAGARTLVYAADIGPGCCILLKVVFRCGRVGNCHDAFLFTSVYEIQGGDLNQLLIQCGKEGRKFL